MSLTNNIVEGVLVYVCVQTPVTKYQSTDKEYKVGIVVDEDTADEWNSRFPKQPAKVVKTSDFNEAYKIDAPFPQEKKQYVINLKKDAQYRDGNPIPDGYKPKAIIRDDKGNGQDITETILIANGSVGKVSFDVRDNDYGTFAKLKNILVTDLIEYQKSGAAGDEFGLAVTPSQPQGASDFEEQGDAPAKPVKAAPRKAKAAVVEEDDFEDEDIPFN